MHTFTSYHIQINQAKVRRQYSAIQYNEYGNQSDLQGAYVSSRIWTASPITSTFKRPWPWFTEYAYRLFCPRVEKVTDDHYMYIRPPLTIFLNFNLLPIVKSLLVTSNNPVSVLNIYLGCINPQDNCPLTKYSYAIRNDLSMGGYRHR